MGFWQFLASTLVRELVGAFSKWITDAIALQKKRKKDKQLVENAIKEKDPKQRASNIRNILS